MLWIGLSQLLIFPFVPFLMKKSDLHTFVCFGVIVFGASCYMNISMSPAYSGPTFSGFFWPDIVRPLSRFFTIVQLSTLATSMLKSKEPATGSAIFNIARNIGGSVGIALISTIITRREQSHDFRIGEAVTAYSLPAQNRLQTIAAHFMAHGSGPATAMQQADAAIKGMMSKNAYAMATSDALMIVGICLRLGGMIVWIRKKPDIKGAAPAH